jgi:adenine-specific DNA-methyltransferase
MRGEDPTDHPPPSPLTEERRTALARIAPEAFREGRLDLGALAAMLGEHVDPGPERYGLSWAGKAAARRRALEPTAATLRPARAGSLRWEESRDVFVQGDNLEVLKVLGKSYRGQVKLIYLDPPYNTGRDFIYPDHFRDGLDAYLRFTGQRDGDGVPLRENPETDGRYHTRWLSFMYPRLLLARGFLKREGVLFISIDHHEVHNLRHLLDEVFGPENFLAEICHKARASVSNDKLISTSHHTILLYARDREAVLARADEFGLEPRLDGFDLEDERGRYKLVPLDGPGGAARGNPYYVFEGVSGHWRYSEATMRKKFDEGLVVKVGGGLLQKYYRAEAEASRRTDVSWWDDGLYTSTATQRLRALMGADIFSSPKPVELVERMLRLWARDDDDLVLDFFAGSGTTGHAVWARSRADGVRRRFLLVQLPEPLERERGAHPEALEFCRARGLPPNIAELTKARLRAAAAQLADGDRGPGFRAFELAPSAFTDGPARDAPLEGQLRAAIHGLSADRSDEDVLTELLLRFGLELTVPVEAHLLAGQRTLVAAGGALVVCLAATLSLAYFQAVAELAHALGRPAMRLVVRDSAFADDADKAAALAMCRAGGMVEVVAA